MIVLNILISKTVYDSNKKAAKDKDAIDYIKLNQYITAGKRGLRKRKGINEEMINESDGKTVRCLTIRGKTRTKHIL